jgi:hypothetical protein
MKHIILWDVVHNVAFCPIAKVSSTFGKIAPLLYALDHLPLVAGGLHHLVRELPEHGGGEAGSDPRHAGHAAGEEQHR